jgi:hypothetical protein
MVMGSFQVMGEGIFCFADKFDGAYGVGVAVVGFHVKEADGAVEHDEDFLKRWRWHN